MSQPDGSPDARNRPAHATMDVVRVLLQEGKKARDAGIGVDEAKDSIVAENAAVTVRDSAHTV